MRVLVSLHGLTSTYIVESYIDNVCFRGVVWDSAGIYPLGREAHSSDQSHLLGASTAVETLRAVWVESDRSPIGIKPPSLETLIAAVNTVCSADKGSLVDPQAADGDIAVGRDIFSIEAQKNS